MKRYVIALSLIIPLVFPLAGCKDVGFRQLDVTSRNRASVQTARDLMEQLQQGLTTYYEEKHHYPVTTGAYLYDSVGRLVRSPVDATHLYRNDNGRGYFMAVGGRANRIVYSYPPTVGPGEYTLYWVGPNGVDENDEGDDVDAWTNNVDQRKLERRRTMDLDEDGIDDRLTLIRTGDDDDRDSVRFEIRQHDTILYRDSWPIAVYFEKRPQLSVEERHRIIHLEVDRFFDPAAFLPADSITSSKFGPLAIPEADLRKYKGEMMFSYYVGDRGSKGLLWIPGRRQFVVIWKS
jgi:hypothetical protein